MEYHTVEPWGFEVEDLRHGILAEVVARAAGADVHAQDFMVGPIINPEEEEQERDWIGLLADKFGAKKTDGG